ncbi:MAG: hypothetical protein AB7U92_24420, partial [Piscinibacter sp.]|uniref:hypothetical protein n=1 Tax=Piscinibacter sp. TaxID=1903157 RepID=UPI003D146CC0
MAIQLIACAGQRYAAVQAMPETSEWSSERALASWSPSPRIDSGSPPQAQQLDQVAPDVSATPVGAP